MPRSFYALLQRQRLRDDVHRQPVGSIVRFEPLGEPQHPRARQVSLPRSVLGSSLRRERAPWAIGGAGAEVFSRDVVGWIPSTARHRRDQLPTRPYQTFFRLPRVDVMMNAPTPFVSCGAVIDSWSLSPFLPVVRSQEKVS